jgi:hypothetical protein
VPDYRDEEVHFCSECDVRSYTLALQFTARRKGR